MARDQTANHGTSGDRMTFRKIGVSIASVILVAGVILLAKDRAAGNAADFSRRLLGEERTSKIEGMYFGAQDRLDRLEFRLFRVESHPFGTRHESLQRLATSAEQQIEQPPIDVAESPTDVPLDLTPPKPSPMPLPNINPLVSNVANGEAAWTTDGLPHSSPEDVSMAKTLIRPDPLRPYAAVGVLLMDKRRIRLRMVGGTDDPGGDRGVRGPGTIPQADLSSLLAGWNGGFKGPHGAWGMVADGKEYRPLRAGYASVAVSNDGTISLGQWGRDLTWSDDFAAVRQNAVLLVDNCQVSPRTNEGNNTWGYVYANSADFITWRSAIGITSNGDLMVADGNSLSAASLARALQSAGACYAMQLDINTPYVLTSLFFPQDGGSVRSTKFMDTMVDNPGRFLTRQARDFMYVTLDATNYKP
jgi:Phosphodiester glycosidase